MDSQPIPKPDLQPGHTIPARKAYLAFSRVVSGIMIVLCVLAAVLAIGFLGIIFGYIVYQGFTSLNLNFFTHGPAPSGDPSGMLNGLAGSGVLILLASLLGIPLGMLAGTYLSQFARVGRFAALVRATVEVLAGMPSIVVGILAYELLVAGHGYSGWAGAVALAFIMCPIICKTTEEMLKLVPGSLREASLALGASESQTLFHIILPAAKTGIITGIMLAIARVAGETAPLLFTIMGNDSVTFNPNKPMSALPLQIYRYATSAENDWQRQAWAGMLVLVVLIFALNLAMRWVLREKALTRR